MSLRINNGQSKVTEAALDPERIRTDFPILSSLIKGQRLVYLDNAATAQKPTVVLDAVQKFYRETNSNIHRGVHTLSQRATASYEAARETVRRFLNARSAEEIVFVRGATEAINLIASSYGRPHVGPGDEVLITELEHHSNIVPWQMLCQEKKALLKVAPISEAGEVDLERFQALLSAKTKMAAISHVSNALGTINPVKSMIAMAHERGIPVLVDGAQAVAHVGVDVRDLDCDFYVFSAHKMYGPTGVGVLYAKASLLDSMPPYQGGGDMIKSVTFEKTTYNDLPYRFEAGTPNISGGIGLGAALEYFSAIDRDALMRHESDVLSYATAMVSEIPGLRIIGTAKEKAAVLSFVIEGIHPHDIGTILDEQGIAIRTGHHCAQPVMLHYGVAATARASLAMYNTREDIDRLVDGLHRVMEVFG